jgi:unsaturated chondroitin disaccharide hydrolase
MACLGVLAVVALAGSRARALDFPGTAASADFANQQLAATASGLSPQSSPSTTRADGSWQTVANTDLTNWTQGFFPGANWYVYALTGDASAKTRADQWTRALEAQKTNTTTHDLGFKFMPSYGHAYESTGDSYYKGVLLTAAASLASRYDPAVGAIICCDWNPAWHRPVVIDTMMNVELLLWGAKNGGQQAWRDMAVNHALKTLADLVRADGSTYHVADYSTAGALLWRGTLQGYSDSSTWTRGQAWAIYGYTMLYRYTADPRMLAAAKEVTDFYLNRLGTGAVPNWDFDAPAEHKDSSAAAAVASALIELSGFVTVPDRQRYFNAATSMLESLGSAAYLAKGTTSHSILLHGVGNLPAGSAIDAGLIYGDYYLLEALVRFRAASATTTSSDGGVPVDTDGGVASATPDGGSQPVVDGGGGPSGSGSGTDTPTSASAAGGCASGPDATFGVVGLLVAAVALRRRPTRRRR